MLRGISAINTVLDLVWRMEEELLPGIYKAIRAELGRWPAKILLWLIFLGIGSWMVKLFWDNAIWPVVQIVESLLAPPKVFDLRLVTIRAVVLTVLIYGVVGLVGNWVLRRTVYRKAERALARADEAVERAKVATERAEAAEARLMAAQQALAMASTPSEHDKERRATTCMTCSVASQRLAISQPTTAATSWRRGL